MILADSIDEIFKYINTGGTVGILAFIIISGARGWWVFGWQYKDLQERYKKVDESNAMWMQLALRGVNVTEQVVKNIPVSDAATKQ